MSRTVVWFSCGAASASAAKLTLEQNPDAVIARCIVPNEHPDNDRFAADCADWFGKEIINLRSDKYAEKVLSGALADTLRAIGGCITDPPCGDCAWCRGAALGKGEGSR